VRQTSAMEGTTRLEDWRVDHVQQGDVGVLPGIEPGEEDKDHGAEGVEGELQGCCQYEWARKATMVLTATQTWYRLRPSSLSDSSRCWS
jgi:hypothetical protein